jgi:hypothetical protein
MPGWMPGILTLMCAPGGSCLCLPSCLCTSRSRNVWCGVRQFDMSTVPAICVWCATVLGVKTGRSLCALAEGVRHVSHHRYCATLYCTVLHAGPRFYQNVSVQYTHTLHDIVPTVLEPCTPRQTRRCIVLVDRLPSSLSASLHNCNVHC